MTGHSYDAVILSIQPYIFISSSVLQYSTQSYCILPRELWIKILTCGGLAVSSALSSTQMLYLLEVIVFDIQHCIRPTLRQVYIMHCNLISQTLVSVK